MCGIAGIYNFGNKKPVGLDNIKNMLGRIKHRGPDESGVFLGNGIGLGNVRLSIIDLQTGQQPISNSDGTLWIVFNGEIFNYIELKEELVKKGHIFQTNSDTEVVVHLYEEYGHECLQKLNGQFAIAIWNTKKKELFLARDRVGIRPLFYTKVNNTFVFASEIKAIIEHPEVNPTISPESLSQIFTFWTTLSPNTAFQEIFELPPGFFMLVNSSTQITRSYWELPFPASDQVRNIKLEDAINEFHELFYDAVRIRLRADVPVGAYLSGGIDSSITTAYINSVFPDILRTFSIGFTEKEFDESSFQKMAVDYLKTNHTGIKCSPEEIAKEFPKVVWHSEIPLLRTAPTPMYLLSRSVRENNYKVVITGEGADEMLAGYNIFKESMIRRFWSRQPNSKYRPLLLQKLYPYLPQMKKANSNLLKFFFGYKLTETDSPFYSHLLRWNNTSRIKYYFSDYYKESTKDYNPAFELEERLPKDFKKMDPLSKAQWLESSIFMSGYLLSSQGDRMSMANSVEGRYPFLDHRIIEFCSKLPSEFKLNGLTEKYLLKKMMRGRLPDQIIDRPKQAYRAPIRSSFILNAPEYLNEILSKKQLKETGIFNPDSVHRLLENMKSGNQVSEVDNMALTAIISTQLLDKQFVQNEKPLIESELANCKVINEGIKT